MAAYWEIAAHSAYDMFSKYKYLIVNLVFSHLGFWSGNFFLIEPFPDHCLLVLFYFLYCNIANVGKTLKSMTEMLPETHSQTASLSSVVHLVRLPMLALSPNY